MKKTILSLAVLTASGGYVALANHAFDGVPALGSAISTQVVASIDDEHEDDDDAPIVLPVPAAPLVPLPAPLLPVEPPTVPVAPVPAPPPTSRAGIIVLPSQPAPISRVAEAVVPASTAKFHDGTYTGSIENAYYGEVQVEATIKGGELVAVKVLDYPKDRRTSRRINSYALPILEEEVIAAQTARVDLVTGATLTSRAYRASLDTALQQADSGHA